MTLDNAMSDSIEQNLLEDLNEQHRQRAAAIAAGNESMALAAQMLFLHGTSAAEMVTAYGYPQVAYVLHARTAYLVRELCPFFDTERARIELGAPNVSYRLN